MEGGGLEERGRRSKQPRGGWVSIDGSVESAGESFYCVPEYLAGLNWIRMGRIASRGEQ